MTAAWARLRWALHQLVWHPRATFRREREVARLYRMWRR